MQRGTDDISRSNASTRAKVQATQTVPPGRSSRLQTWCCTPRLLSDPATGRLLALQEGKVDMGFAVGSSVPGRKTVTCCLHCSDAAGGHLGSWLLLGHARAGSIRANDSVPISALMVPGYITLATEHLPQSLSPDVALFMQIQHPQILNISAYQVTSSNLTINMLG